MVDLVNEAERKIREGVKLPPGYRTQWAGSFENAQRAGKQLLIVVPLCLFAIVVILHTWFGSWRIVGLVLWQIPFSLIGALFALRLANLNLSISAAAGCIVLLGVAFLTGIMLISEWLRCQNAFVALRNSFRSIVLSSGVAIVGLIPAAFSHGIGAETARPFAVSILGGLISSLVLSLTLLPLVLEATPFERLNERRANA
jgi:cobalt-zinc-cadmium resistance protein CzcA